MDVIWISADSLGESVIALGKAGESNALRLDIDVSSWKEEYPDGTYTLYVAPPQPAAPYLAAIEGPDEEGVIHWTIVAADTTAPGRGRIELILTDGETRAKSATAYTELRASPSAAPAGDAPVVNPAWWEAALDEIDTAKRAAVGEVGTAQTEAESAVGAKGSEMLAQIAGQFDDEVAAGEAAIAAANAAAQTDIENKKNAALDYIPDDVETIYNLANQLKESKADGIVDTSARAASHELHAQMAPLNVTVYGKTKETGEGDKSPSNPYTINGVGYSRLIKFSESYLYKGNLNNDGDGTITYVSTGDEKHFGYVVPNLSAYYASTYASWENLKPYQFFVRKDSAVNPNTSFIVVCLPGEFNDRAAIKKWFIDNPQYDKCYIEMVDNADGNNCEIVEAFGDTARNHIVFNLLPDGDPLYGNGEIDDTVELNVLVDGEYKCRTTRRWGRIESYAGETVPSGYISSTGALDTGATVIYPLDTPEIYYSDALKLCPPDGVKSVTVLGGGETAVEYTHDTKHYTDSKQYNPNLYDYSNLEPGYLSGVSDALGTIVPPSSEQKEKTSGYIPVTEGMSYHIRSWITMPTSGSFWSGWQFFDINKVVVGTRSTNLAATTLETAEDEKTVYATSVVTAPTGAAYLRLSERTYTVGRIKVQEEYATKWTDADESERLRLEHTLAEIDAAANHFSAINSIVKSVNHRGYCTVAPENTLSAFKLSKANGFAYAECDVSFTSDGVAVLLHDNTIDRTSNGTGSIGGMTYATASQYDFGSWKSSVYAGEKIPTFEEFIILCKRIGLKPYIELKTAQSPTSDQILGLVNTVKRYGMLADSTWISFGSELLNMVKTHAPTARLGFVIDTPSDAAITWAQNAKTEQNDVFIDVNYNSLTDAFVESCAEVSIPVEVWTINSASALVALDPYVSGFTSDNLVAGEVLYDEFVN